MDDTNPKVESRIQRTLRFVKENQRAIKNTGFFLAGGAAALYCIDKRPIVVEAAQEIPSHLEMFLERTVDEIAARVKENGKTGEEYLRLADRDGHVVDIFFKRSPMEDVIQRHPIA